MSNMTKEDRITMWRETIEELRADGCNKLADRIVEELEREIASPELIPLSWRGGSLDEEYEGAQK
jgi:hypothetical protein